MIRRPTQLPPRNRERGVTMILVVLAMLSMLGIIALAIDVITLYSARSETQRAADAAALAAAKMLVDMGVTTDPTATVPTAAQIDAATKAAQSVAVNATIAGRQVQTGDVTLTFPGQSTPAFSINPKVSVTVQNTNLPTFFSRIWSGAALTVRASATAEGFNPSNSSSIAGGSGVPVVARCVKPFIVPNCDPQHAGAGCSGTGDTFFDLGTGAITHPGVAPAGIIGEGFDLVSTCGPGPGCAPGTPTVGPGPGGPTLYYYPAQLPPATNACPSCAGGGTNFQQDIECCNPTPISCGTAVIAPVVNQLWLDDTVFPEGGGGPAQDGTQCLIHQSGGSGQDTLLSGPPLTYPLQIEVGGNHPLAGTVLSANNLVTTSDSLVTIPVYDPIGPPPTPTSATPVRVIGFLQVFIDQVFPGGGGPKAGEFHVTVVNVSGCGSSASGTPVLSGSAVPVRLIQ
ncbi:MAG: pilus assembly protein TadG-related protein [Terriglobales bacterium]